MQHKYQLWTGSSMVEVGSITFHTDGSYHVNDEYPVNDDNAPGGNPPYRLREWTGLKDKNGKEIYEGDVLEHAQSYSMYHWQVIFELGFFGGKPINISHKRGRIKGRLEALAYLPGSIEIIGNIYENKDLLK